MLSLSLKELQSRFLSGTSLPSYLVQLSLKRMELMSSLNMFVTECPTLAMEQGRESDSRYREGKPKGTLEGVPLAIKDNFCTKDIKTSCGSLMLDNFPSPYNATVVQRCLDQGGIIMGKTNLDEFAMGSGTIDSYVGPTRNVWGGGVSYKLVDREGRVVGEHRGEGKEWVVAGGSSGGSAVAVASGAAVASLGSDTGGSVRIPAAWVGVASIKPSYARVSRHGLVPLVNSLDCPGVMARSVRDLAMVLDCVQGRDIMDSTSVESESIDIGQLEGTCVKGLKVGIPQEFLCEGMSEEVVDSWSKVARLLEEGGAEVEPVSLPHTELAIPCYSVLNPCEVASNMARYDGLQFGLRGEAISSTEDMYAESRARGFNEVVRGRILAGNYFLLKKHYQEYYLQALKVRRMVTQDYLSAWSKVDLLLTPVTLTTAPTFSNFTQRDNRSQTATQDFCTQPINLAGVPALTLPSSLSSNNLPISIQLVAPLNQDPMLLRVGAWLEDRLDFPKLVIDEELD